MRVLIHKIIIATGKTLGILIGLMTLPVLAFLLVQLILLLMSLWITDTLRAIAFIAQFPATLYVMIGRKK